MQSEQDGPLSRERAVEYVLSLRRELLTDLDTEPVRLEDASGRILGQPIVATEDQPPRSFATMDGFAFDATDEYPLTVVDDAVFPEDDPRPLGAGDAVRIATGAPLPEGATAVLKREEATVEDGHLHGAEIAPGTYTYERGSNVEKGETLFEIGERLSPKDALLLGDLGLDELEVFGRFSVGLLATGTEIHEGRMRDLDSPMLAGLVRTWGHDAVYEGTVADRYDAVVDRIADLADRHHIVMTTGGTSVGKKDYVIRALEDLGTVHFHRVALRPGKPIAFATLPDHDTIAIAIPGKPVGAHTVATLVVRPFFRGSTVLPTVEASLARDIGIGAPGFEYVVPVELNGTEAMPLGHVDSDLSVYDETFDPSVLSSSTRASRADGFFLTESPVAAGTTVGVVPYEALE